MTRFFHCCIVALILAVLMLSLTACGGASQSPSPTSPQAGGVRGMAMIEGGPTAGPRPEPGITVTVHEGDLHGAIVARTKADASGAFRVDLPPGIYALIEDSDSAVPQTVTVEPGKYVTVTLTIQAF